MKVRTRWVGPNPGEVVPSQLRNGLQRQILEIVGRAVDNAVENAKKFTLSRPSKKSGKSGRYETYAMANAIMGEVKHDALKKVSARVGFIDDKQLYYYLQTMTGFYTGNGRMSDNPAPGSIDFVEPTFAVRDAVVLMLKEIEEGLVDMGARG